MDSGKSEKVGIGHLGGARSENLASTIDTKKPSALLHLLTMFAKNERANLSKAERNELAGLVDLLVQIWLER